MNSKSKTPRLVDYNDGGRIAAAAMNDNVLTEILLWLPAKSVIRFKLVCKSWLSIISGDQFRRLHTLRRHKPQPSLLLGTPDSRFFYLNPIINGDKKVDMVPYSFTLPTPKILSACNGLLLLQSNNPQTDYYVYNPTTKQSRKFILDYDSIYPNIMGLNLAFDPSKSPHSRIVCVRGSRKKLFVVQSYQIQVYNSVSHTWNLCLESFSDSRNINFSYGVHCHNSIYWKMSHALLIFDIDKNVIGTLSCSMMSWFMSLQLQESNGHLHLFVMDHECASAAVWELQGDDDHSQWWFLMYKDYAECCLVEYYNPLGSFHTFGLCSTSLLRFIMGSDGDETTSTLVAHIPGQIFAYRFLDKSFDELAELTNQPFYDEDSLQFDFQDVHQFGESLAVV